MSKKVAAVFVGLVVLQIILIFQTAGAEQPNKGNSTASQAEEVGANHAEKPSADAPLSEKEKLEKLTAHSEQAKGLWTVYYGPEKMLVELPRAHLDKNFIVLTSIARGIGHGMVLGGMSWGYPDSVLWAFHRVGEKVQVLRRNVRFRATPGTPEAEAVKFAYSDSVLYSLPIELETPDSLLLDMTPLFMNDDQQIGKFIGAGFRFAEDRSTLSKVKSFPQNVEIEVAAVYSGSKEMDTVSDPRGVQVHVHYSLSMLPENDGYVPRKADDRVGYFLTAVKDYSDKQDDQHFVRYINRWNLKKKDPKAKLSPPEKPIVFYIEKTVPVYLRPYVRAGIEEWNKAFEKLGFSNAIEVRQQMDDDQWDPEDIRYNSFRWITADAGFALGPTRVNPLTGEILDADIIFDASFLDFWKQDYENFTAEDVTVLMGGTPKDEADRASRFAGAACRLSQGMQQQMAFAAAAMTGIGGTEGKGVPDEFIFQALKEAVMHEVGHALGLRHNFKASSWKSLDEIARANAASDEPFVASVMDYCPPNISAGAKPAEKLYFTPTIGPYDLWAIEYGYKPHVSDGQLARLAGDHAGTALDFATDEDTRALDCDPLSFPFDLGNDPIAYAEHQMDLASRLLPTILDRCVQQGEGYQRARQAFGILLGEYWRAAYIASRLIGGVYVHRDHKGDPDARPPIEVVKAASQREAMRLITEKVMKEVSFEPSLLNHLATTNWNQWGMKEPQRLDYPIHEVVAAMNSRILYQLLNPVTLARLQDNELKIPAEEDAYTLAEHIDRLFRGIFAEIVEPKSGSYQNRNPFITSFRRDLQQMTLKQVGDLLTNGGSFPDDARTLSRMHLARLGEQIEAVLTKSDLQLDDYSRAHLIDCKESIRQVLNAQLQLTAMK